VCYFREKILSWLGAGTYHSVALSIEGYAYSWGRNNRGQLGHGDAISTATESKLSCPRIIEQTLGIGVAQAFCNFNQTFFGMADKLSKKPDQQVFNVWK
jgi:alpha-tubulin suppressor-like RCC1 family protein